MLYDIGTSTLRRSRDVRGVVFLIVRMDGLSEGVAGYTKVVAQVVDEGRDDHFHCSGEYDHLVVFFVRVDSGRLRVFIDLAFKIFGVGDVVVNRLSYIKI